MLSSFDPENPILPATVADHAHEMNALIRRLLNQPATATTPPALLRKILDFLIAFHFHLSSIPQACNCFYVGAGRRIADIVNDPAILQTISPERLILGMILFGASIRVNANQGAFFVPVAGKMVYSRITHCAHDPVGTVAIIGLGLGAAIAPAVIAKRSSPIAEEVIENFFGAATEINYAASRGSGIADGVDLLGEMRHVERRQLRKLRQALRRLTEEQAQALDDHIFRHLVPWLEGNTPSRDEIMVEILRAACHFITQQALNLEPGLRETVCNTISGIMASVLAIASGAIFIPNTGDGFRMMISGVMGSMKNFRDIHLSAAARAGTGLLGSVSSFFYGRSTLALIDRFKANWKLNPWMTVRDIGWNAAAATGTGKVIYDILNEPNDLGLEYGVSYSQTVVILAIFGVFITNLSSDYARNIQKHQVHHTAPMSFVKILLEYLEGGKFDLAQAKKLFEASQCFFSKPCSRRNQGEQFSRAPTPSL